MKKEILKNSNNDWPSKSGNLLSDLTNGEITSVDFGKSIPEIGFDVDEWNRHYGPNRPQSVRESERFYLEQSNRRRASNGLPPLTSNNY